MTRLVNAMREKISDNLMAHTFADRCRTQVKEQAALALAAYNDFYAAGTRKAMESLPDGWLPTDSDIRLRVENSDLQLNFNGSFSGKIRGLLYAIDGASVPQIDRRFLHADMRRFLKVYEVSSSLGRRLEDFQTANRQLLEDLNAARQKASVMLDKFYTTEKLIEAWPEIAPMTVGIFAPPPASLPMVPTAELNDLFKLPVAAT